MDELKMKINEQLQQLQMLMHRASFNPFGKTRSPYRGQGRVLALLRLKPEISQKELTYLLNMSKQAVAELIAKLEKSGYVTRRPSEEDKRVLMVRLTEAGEKAAAGAEDTTPEIAPVLDCLSQEEQAAFSGYLERILREYEAQFPDEDFEERRQMMDAFMQHYGHGFYGHGHHHGQPHGRGPTRGPMGPGPFMGSPYPGRKEDE